MAPEAVAPEAVTADRPKAPRIAAAERAGNDRGVAAGPGRRAPPPARQAPPCRQIVWKTARDAPQLDARRCIRLRRRAPPAVSPDSAIGRTHTSGRACCVCRARRRRRQIVQAGASFAPSSPAWRGSARPIVRGDERDRPPAHAARPERHERQDRHERREKAPDPNSPFAKLAALKAQLEADAKERALIRRASSRRPVDARRQRIDRWLWHARLVRTRRRAAALARPGLCPGQRRAHRRAGPHGAKPAT